MKTILQVLKEKGHEAWSVAPEASVFKALEIMADKDIGALLVMKGKQVVGIFSERDYARKVILEGKSSRTTTVQDIMTTSIVFIGPDQTSEQGMVLMTEKHVRHLPVFEGKKLLGIVSIGDLVKAIITEQKIVINKLEKYMTSSVSPT